jgi:predicted esterase
VERWFLRYLKRFGIALERRLTVVHSRARYLVAAAGCLVGLVILPLGCETGKPSGSASNTNTGASPTVPVSAPAGGGASTVAPATVAATGTGILPPGVSRVTSAPLGKTAGQRRRAGGDPVDDRVEVREYGFQETNENMPYAVFVSSKVTKDKKPPLVLALHGYGGNYGTFMRTGCVDAAEQGGYILVGVMGYSPSAPFGNRSMGRGPGRGPATGPGTAPAGGRRGAGPGALGPMIDGEELVFVGMPGGGIPGGAPGAAPGGAPGAAPGARGAFPGAAPGAAGGRGTVGGTAVTDATRVSELSEIDTMRVLEMTRKEFNADENRIYLMGHSMGGAGAMYIGEKYAPMWAAVACLAGFGSPDPQGKMKDTPLYMTAGSLDTLGAGGSSTAARLKAAGMDCEWKEVPGLDHGGIIAGAMPDVFAFFDKHIKGQKK